MNHSLPQEDGEIKEGNKRKRGTMKQFAFHITPFAARKALHDELLAVCVMLVDETVVMKG